MLSQVRTERQRDAGSRPAAAVRARRQSSRGESVGEVVSR